MTENQNVTSNGDNNQSKPRKKNNNYYKKNKNRPYKSRTIILNRSKAKTAYALKILIMLTKMLIIRRRHIVRTITVTNVTEKIKETAVT